MENLDRTKVAIDRGRLINIMQTDVARVEWEQAGLVDGRARAVGSKFLSDNGRNPSR